MITRVSIGLVRFYCGFWCGFFVLRVISKVLLSPGHYVTYWGVDWFIALWRSFLGFDIFSLSFLMVNLWFCLVSDDENSQNEVHMNCWMEFLVIYANERSGTGVTGPQM